MALRTHLLSIILWCLGIGAVVGSVAILTNGSSVMWRVSGTTVLTAVAAAVLLPLSWWMDRPAGRASGQLGIAATILVYFLTLLEIWELTYLFPVTRAEEAVGMTIGFTILCALPAVFLLRVLTTQTARVASIVGLAVAVSAYASFLIGAWTRGAWSVRDVWLPSGAAIGGIGALLAGCLIGMNGARPLDRRLIAIRYLGAAAAALGLAITLWAVWNDIHEESGVLTTLLSIAAVITHMNLCTLTPLKAAQRWIGVATISAGALTAVLVDVLAFNPGAGESEFIVTRVAGAAGFVASCGSLGLLILARLNRRMYAPPRPFSEVKTVVVICPGCDTRREMPIGASSCPSCRLAFNIRIEEPRCPHCDYLLFRLQGDRCPECGAALEDAGAAVDRLPD